MPAGLPWDDPESDPIGDLTELLRQWRAAEDRRLRGLDPASRRREQYERWCTYHLLACGGSFLFERHNSSTKWIQCATCNHRLILPFGEGVIRGQTPVGVIIDELADAERWSIHPKQSGKSAAMQTFVRERLNEWTMPTDPPQAPEPGLLDLCLEHPCLVRPTDADRPSG